MYVHKRTAQKGNRNLFPLFPRARRHIPTVRGVPVHAPPLLRAAASSGPRRGGAHGRRRLGGADPAEQGSTHEYKPCVCVCACMLTAMPAVLNEAKDLSVRLYTVDKKWINRSSMRSSHTVLRSFTAHELECGPEEHHPKVERKGNATDETHRRDRRWPREAR